MARFDRFGVIATGFFSRRLHLLMQLSELFEMRFDFFRIELIGDWIGGVVAVFLIVTVVRGGLWIGQRLDFFARRLVGGGVEIDKAAD